MKDWFDKGFETLREEINEVTGVSPEDIARVYSFLSEIGLVDYDIEKEIIWDRYFAESGD